MCFDTYRVSADWSSEAIKVSGNQCCQGKAECQPGEFEVHSESPGGEILEVSWVGSGMSRIAFQKLV